MATTNQLIRKGRRKRRKRSDAPQLKGCSQKSGIVVNVSVFKPKKPNSANRCICRVKLSTGHVVIAYVPGEKMGSNISEHTPLLIRGGGPPDLVGVKYTVIPGGGKMIPGSVGWNDGGGGRHDAHRYPRRVSRSKYGVSKEALKIAEGQRK